MVIMAWFKHCIKLKLVLIQAAPLTIVRIHLKQDLKPQF